MSHTITVTPRERHLRGEQRWALKITCRRRATWLHGDGVARPWVRRRYVSRLGPRWARHRPSSDHEGGQAEDPVCPHEDHGRRQEGARKLTARAPCRK